jgi:hypothetical protein
MIHLSFTHPLFCTIVSGRGIRGRLQPDRVWRGGQRPHNQGPQTRLSGAVFTIAHVI